MSARAGWENEDELCEARKKRQQQPQQKRSRSRRRGKDDPRAQLVQEFKLPPNGLIKLVDGSVQFVSTLDSKRAVLNLLLIRHEEAIKARALELNVHSDVVRASESSHPGLEFVFQVSVTTLRHTTQHTHILVCFMACEIVDPIALRTALCCVNINAFVAEDAMS